MVAALVRGRFCESVTAYDASGDPAARFLVGMLSRMDVLLGLPMHEVLERLPVKADIREALLEHSGPHASVLRLADAYEKAEWALVQSEGHAAALAELGEMYAEAVAWAGERLSYVRG